MKKIETFKEYQEKAKTVALYLDKVMAKWPNLPKEVYKIMGISYVGNGLGEVGEIQNKIKKIIRDSGGDISDETRKEISKEVGDSLWYIAMVAEELDLSLDDIATQNIEKLFSRRDRNVLGGSGDNR